jgi:electron transport complex protein RnfC
MILKTRAIKDHKLQLGGIPTEKVAVPDFLFLATNNARCAAAEVTIPVGAHVNLGEPIGIRHAAYFDQPIHATASGTFVGLEKHYHRSGKIVDFIKIQNDFKDTLDPSIHDRTDAEIAQLTRADMAEILKEDSLVGLGGSSFPTYVKFQTSRPIKTILLNGIECEPFITADQRLLLEDPADLIAGIKLLQQAFSCRDARICVKAKHRDIFALYAKVLAAYPNSGITIVPVGNFYPQGWEIAMIKSATGISVPVGHLPSEYGIANFNVSTAAGVYLAVKHRMPVYERYVSVCGDGIVSPKNFSVRVGTPVKFLIDRCGGYKNPEIPKVFILGGPMMGASLPSDDCILTKTVTSVIVMNERTYSEEPCIRCGSCVLSCPVGIQPVQIMNAMRQTPVDKDKVKALNPLLCIECGLCTYCCTSMIPLLEYVRRAKIVAKLP